MNIISVDDDVQDLVQRDVVAVLGLDGPRGSLREESSGAAFVVVDVGAGVEDDGVGWLSEVCAYGELIGLFQSAERDELASEESAEKSERGEEALTIVPLTANIADSFPANLATFSSKSLVA
jgi:hypothetical protein